MTTDEILQISNDISEDMISSKITKAQLIEVIQFFRNQSDVNWEKYVSLRTELVLFATKQVTG